MTSSGRTMLSWDSYRYDISILQAEFSTTQVLDCPVHDRVLLEQMIRENLDLGRPEEIRASRPASLSGPTALNYLANGLSCLAGDARRLTGNIASPSERSPRL